MSRLFLQIALVLLLVLAIASGLASQLLRMQLGGAMDGQAPGPVVREVNLIHWALSDLGAQEQLERINTLQKEYPVNFQLLPMSQISSSLKDNLVESGPMFSQFREEKIVYLWLGEENGILAIGPYKLPTPFRPSQLLLVMGVILPMVGIAAFFLAAPVVRRLRQLEKASLQISRGDLTARVGFDSQDAIGDLARQFNQMAKRIERLLESQKHLLGAVSHELRTPASRIEFLLEKIQDTDDAVERSQKVDDIRVELAELDALVGELLLFTRFDSLEEAPAVEMTAVIPLLNDSVTRLVHLYPEKEVVFCFDVSSEFQFPLNGTNFRRVVQNLVSNALRYSARTVEVHCHLTGNDLCLAVENDGVGIPVEFQDKIFEPFFRVDEARSRNSGGSGLGLAIVKRILDSHHGSVGVEETACGNTRFTTKWTHRI